MSAPARKRYRVYLGGPDDYEAAAEVLLTEAEADVVRYVGDELSDPEECRPDLTIEEVG